MCVERLEESWTIRKESAAKRNKEKRQVKQHKKTSNMWAGQKEMPGKCITQNKIWFVNPVKLDV